MTNLAKACELSLNDWLETFPDTIPEAECSKKHEKWKKNLLIKCVMTTITDLQREQSK